MRFVTYNVHGWRTIDGRPNVAAIASVLEKCGAEIVGLNEVYHPWPGVAGMAALGWVANQLDMFCAFGCCEYRSQTAAAGTGYGNALLSKYPFRTISTGQFRPLPGKEQRGLLVGGIDVPGSQSVRVCVTHLDHTEEQARLDQADDLLNWSESNSVAFDLIMGDLNAIHLDDYQERPGVLQKLAEHAIARHLVDHRGGPQLTSVIEQAGYVDAFSRRSLLGQGTFIPADEPVRFDYVFLRPGMFDRVSDAGVFVEEAGNEASDHRPVFVDTGF